MGVTALIGLQWGDEGKGKIVDVLARSMHVVVRAQGGANAGHTVIADGVKYVLHLIPSGMLSPGVRGVIGNGVVVDPFQVLKEIEALEAAGHEISGRLAISGRAHLVLPWHGLLDSALETERGEFSLGTTRRGIGPAYMDKTARDGIRACELLDEVRLVRTVRETGMRRNRMLAAMGSPVVPLDELLDRLLPAAQSLRGLIVDTVDLLHGALARGQSILLEGAQGALLDLDLGTYPFVTSSNCHLGGLLAGSGLPPASIERVIGVSKAYATRVGSGPFPTEEAGPVGDALRKRGGEFGATTGRPRRCGWLDLPALRFAVATNGVTEIALTKSDVLSGQPVLRFACSYKDAADGALGFPPPELLGEASPVYTDLPGFDGDLGGVDRFQSLPVSLRSLVEAIEQACRVPVSILSTGPGREHVIWR